MAGIAFIYLARNFGKLPVSFKIGILEIIIGIFVIFATLVMQTWMYSLFLQHYGAKPEFGIFRNNVIAYISAPGYGLRRNSIIVTALAPLFALIGLALLGIWLFQGTAWVALFALIAVTSAGASTSHLWMIAILLRYPSSAWTVDDEHGMRILLPMENKSFLQRIFSTAPLGPRDLLVALGSGLGVVVAVEAWKGALRRKGAA